MDLLKLFLHHYSSSYPQRSQFLASWRKMTFFGSQQPIKESVFFFGYQSLLAMVALKNLVKGLEDKNAELEVKHPGKVTDTERRKYLSPRDHSMPCDHFPHPPVLPRRASIINFALLSRRNKQTHTVPDSLTL